MWAQSPTPNVLYRGESAGPVGYSKLAILWKVSWRKSLIPEMLPSFLRARHMGLLSLHPMTTLSMCSSIDML